MPADKYRPLRPRRLRPSSSPRLLLDPDAAIWTKGGLEQKFYFVYETASAQPSLSQCLLPPPLDHLEFIQQYD